MYIPFQQFFFRIKDGIVLYCIIQNSLVLFLLIGNIYLFCRYKQIKRQVRNLINDNKKLMNLINKK